MKAPLVTNILLKMFLAVWANHTTSIFCFRSNLRTYTVEELGKVKLEIKVKTKKPAV
ncbi:hypothetical protein P781_06375 [Vibrio mimicus CAIM 1883]|nr:hypothetical protein P780_06365 [Vibrio mimicus CAIM 1882]ERM58681.1 hypothetical protein P781_06375 [Vibrio mimicus CAIM 1883]